MRETGVSWPALKGPSAGHRTPAACSFPAASGAAAWRCEKSAASEATIRLWAMDLDLQWPFGWDLDLQWPFGWELLSHSTHSEM